MLVIDRIKGVIEITIHYNKVQEQRKQLNQVYFNLCLRNTFYW